MIHLAEQFCAMIIVALSGVQIGILLERRRQDRGR